MKSFFSFVSQTNSQIRSLPLIKKFFFSAFLIIFIFSFLGIINQLSNRFAIPRPAYNGTITEGILGTPRFINPVLAISDADRDLTRIIYSGLVRSNNNSIIPDLAESYSLSEDGKTYTFVLKPDIVFHNKKPITTADVAFTVTTIQDTRFQSPLLPQWSGVTTNIINDTTISFTLPRPFSGFLESVAQTGIIPKNIWGNFTIDEFIASNYNVSPIGSGPYALKKISRDATGTAKSYTLKSFRKFALGNPFVEKFVIKFYPNEQSLFQGYQTKSFDLLANIQPYEITSQNTHQVVSGSLPRVFGLFINESNSEILKDKKLQNIISSAIERDEIIQTVFQGYARPITNPINLDTATAEHTPEKATLEKELENIGWKLNPETGIREKEGKQLVWSISTADTSELKYTAQIIQKQLKLLGIEIEIKIFQLNDLESSVIKKRAFETLLFGQLIKNDGDIYAFWHSTQRNNLELNITGYTHPQIDTTIESLIATTDTEAREKLLFTLSQEIAKAPVIWLFQPDFIYATNTKIHGLNALSITTRNDRFNAIYNWYTHTDYVWKFFANK